MCSVGRLFLCLQRGRTPITVRLKQKEQMLSEKRGNRCAASKRQPSKPRVIRTGSGPITASWVGAGKPEDQQPMNEEDRELNDE